MALDVVIYPGAFSLIDSESNTSIIRTKLKIPKRMYLDDQKGNTSYSGGALGKSNNDTESDDYDLYNSWLGTGGEVNVADAPTEKSTTVVAQFAFKDQGEQDQFCWEKASGYEVPRVEEASS
ncbi:hypothetical protein AgCh_029661 [Apium graveolens]